MKKIYFLTLSILLIVLHPLLAQTYQQTQKLTASDARQEAIFGTAISAFGNYVVIGAPYSDDYGEGDDLSRAYVFEKTTSGWKEVQQLKADLPAIYTPGLGKSVHTDGTRIIVGAPWEALLENPSDFNVGTAYIFEKSSSGWNKVDKLTALNREHLAHFGSAVAISGNRALAGAFGQNAAYFFEKTTSGWQQVARFSHYKNFYNEYFGSTVALYGDYAIVGHSGNTSEGLGAGAAYLYERTASGWQEVQMVVAPDAKVNAYFGASVAINDTYAVIGNADPEHNNNQLGAVYIFERTGKGWVSAGKLTASDGKANDWFGRSVSVLGNKIIVGAPGNASAYVFEKTSTGWQQIGKISATANSFGNAVAIANDEYFVGVPQDNNNTGSAYVFAKAAATPVQSIARFTLINARTDQPIAGYEDLQDGTVIDLNKTGLSGADKYNQFNMDIITSPAKVGSVKMVLTGPNSVNATQNVAPYALFNDNSAEGFLPGSLPAGSYTLTATPYTESQLKGTAGASRTIRFTVVDPQEPPPATNLVVSRLVLLDADTDKDLLELTDRATVNPASYNLKNFNVRADVPSVVRSVSMVLSGKLSHTTTESKLPFALYGDDNGNYRPGGALLAGSYTLTITPYSSTSLGGEKGQVKIIQFTVVDQPVTETPPAITFTLINADTGQDLLPLSQNKIVDLTAYNTKNFNIRANTPASAASVRIELKGAVNHSVLESKLPFALYGDASGDYNPGALPEGSYTLTATPYTERYGKGTAGTPVTVAFTVIRSTPQPRVNAPVAEAGIAEQPILREEKQDFNVFPNPVEKDMHVVYQGDDQEVILLSVYDIMGQLLRQVSAQGHLEQTLDLSGYPAGVYMAVLEHGGQRSTKRFYIRK